MLTFDGKPICASAVYGLKTDGITLSGNGTAESPIGFINNPSKRYEKLIYSAANAQGYISGTLTDPPSAFDEIIIGTKYSDVNSTQTQYTNYMVNPNGLYVYQNIFFEKNNIYIQVGHVNIPYSGGDFYVYDPKRLNKAFRTTAYWNTISASQYANRNIQYIIGVKYL